MLRLSLLLLLSVPAEFMLLGWVESPGFPDGYSPHAGLNWSRCAPKGHMVSIRLIHLDVEDSKDCENDGVKVFTNENLISILCGKKELEELQSTVNPYLLSPPGGCLSLSFYSDYSNPQRHSGFRGFYTYQDVNECQDDPDNGCTHFCHNFIGGFYCSCRHGYHLDLDKHTCRVSCTEDLSGLNRGVVSSPSWPAAYTENANCLHTLSVDQHLQLELHFSPEFDVEQSPDGQCIDALRIETSSGTLGPFCGKSPPPSPLITHSNQVHIRFTSDGFGTNKGFSLHFKTKDKVCAAEVTPHSTVTPPQPEYPPGQTVTVTCDLGYIIDTTPAMETLSSEYAATCLRTGIWTPRYTCQLWDCGLPDIPNDGLLQMVGSEHPRTQYKDRITLGCSSEYYKLEGEDTYTCDASGKWVSADGETEMPKCIEVCGTPQISPSSAGRILGGKSAKLGELPWQLFIKDPRRGGASLISDRWAVTAAHVVEKLELTTLSIYGGLVDGRTTVHKNYEMQIDRIIIHPDYSNATGERDNFNNDIALIRFSSRVKLGPNLLPICLPESDMNLVENEQGTVSGWGNTENRNKKTVLPSILKYTHIGVYSLSQCQNTPSMSPTKRMIFTENMFCAGAEGMDSCQKDSGGPFASPMLAGGNEPYYLRGIVSWGAPCSLKQYKGYYTKVDNYVNWIKKIMEENETS